MPLITILNFQSDSASDETSLSVSSQSEESEESDSGSSESNSATIESVSSSASEDSTSVSGEGSQIISSEEDVASGSDETSQGSHENSSTDNVSEDSGEPAADTNSGSVEIHIGSAANDSSSGEDTSDSVENYSNSEENSVESGVNDQSSEESGKGSAQSNSGSGESNSDSTESGSEENVGDTSNKDKNKGDKVTADDIIKKFHQILTDLHDIFVKSNATIILPMPEKDSASNIDVPGMLDHIFSDVTSENDILRPGVEVSMGPNNPNMVNVLEGLFTKIIKNKIVINNNVPVSYQPGEISKEKDEAESSKHNKTITSEQEKTITTGKNGTTISVKDKTVTSEDDEKATSEKSKIDEEIPSVSNPGIENNEITENPHFVGEPLVTKGPEDDKNSNEGFETPDINTSGEITPEKDETEHPNENIPSSTDDSSNDDDLGKGSENPNGHVLPYEKENPDGFDESGDHELPFEQEKPDKSNESGDYDPATDTEEPDLSKEISIHEPTIEKPELEGRTETGDPNAETENPYQSGEIDVHEPNMNEPREPDVLHESEEESKLPVEDHTEAPEIVTKAPIEELAEEKCPVLNKVVIYTTTQ